MELGDSVQILEGRKGVIYKVGILQEEIFVGTTLYGYKVRMLNGYVVPVRKDDLKPQTSQGRGEEYRNKNKLI